MDESKRKSRIKMMIGCKDDEKWKWFNSNPNQIKFELKIPLSSFFLQFLNLLKAKQSDEWRENCDQ